MSNVVIEPDSRDQSLLEEMIGYLNFSSGASDASFLKNLNALVAGIERRQGERSLGEKSDAVAVLCDWLARRMNELEEDGGAVGDVRQAPAGVGVAGGPYEELITRALEILANTDPEIRRQAWFDPELLDELALDPRAYEFDHPAGKRPNYHFGQWDQELVDNRGNYRRFVLQQITLDALLSRVAATDSAKHASGKKTQ